MQKHFTQGKMSCKCKKSSLITTEWLWKTSVSKPDGRAGIKLLRKHSSHQPRPVAHRPLQPTDSMTKSKNEWTIAKILEAACSIAYTLILELCLSTPSCSIPCGEPRSRTWPRDLLVIVLVLVAQGMTCERPSYPPGPDSEYFVLKLA